MADIYINYGTNLLEMTYALMDAADIRDRISPSMKIGIKPNLVVARSADEGATTHPEIVEGIICYLQACGVRDITILEGAWVGDNTQKAFKNCGYTALADKYSIKLLDTKQDKAVKMKKEEILWLQTVLCLVLIRCFWILTVHSLWVINRMILNICLWQRSME